MKKEKLPYYWICNTCATERGGTFPKGHICTVTHKECPYCYKTDTIIPIVDFDWDDRDLSDLRD